MLPINKFLQSQNNKTPKFQPQNSIYYLFSKDTVLRLQYVKINRTTAAKIAGKTNHKSINKAKNKTGTIINTSLLLKENEKNNEIGKSENNISGQ